MPTRYMQIEEFSELTARSANQIRNLHYTGKLEVMPIKLGKRLLWDRDEVEAWLRDLKAARAPGMRSSSA